MTKANDNLKFPPKLKNVLAVDNDPIMLKFLTRIFEKAGLHVVTATDGVSALDILKSYKPDLFIIDLVMPNIDGRALCRIIRSKEAFRATPIVIVSAIAAEESIDTDELGANVCIAKVAFPEMAIMINKFINDPQLLWNSALGNRVLGVDDISPRNITDELLTINRHFRVMLDSISSGIIEFDRNRRIIYANPAALRIFSIPYEIMLGSHVNELIKAETNEQLLALISSKESDYEIKNQHVKISIGECILDLYIIPSDCSQDTQVMIIEDITVRETAQKKLIEANRKLEILARIDGLTAVSNRRYFDELLHQEWSRLRREKGELALILCDVDYFKNFNDTYGHTEGDKCLQNIAQVIKSVLKRPSDMAARYGGDEFVLLLPNTTFKGAMHLTEEILDRVRQLQIKHETSPVNDYVTVTLGAGSGVPNDALLEDKFIWLADKALYEAKLKGRNCAIGKIWPLN